MSNAKETERLTRASRETLLTILETLPGALFFLDDSGTIVYANASAQELTEATPEEIIGKPLAQTLWWSGSPANHEKLRAAIARASQGETVHFEAMIQPRKGKDRDLEATITRHVDADRREYLIFAGIAVTAHKRAGEDIHALIDVIPQFVWTMRADGSMEYGNQRWRDYTGLTTEQAQGEGWLRCLHPDDRRRVLEVWRTAVQTGMPYEVEHRIQQGSTGAYRWFLTRGMPHKNAQGTILKWFGTCTDIDEQKQAEERVKKSQQHWRVLAETVPQLVWTVRAEDGLSDYFNQRFCDYTCATWEQLQGYGWSQFVHPDDYERTLATRTHALRTGIPYEVAYRFREGQTGLYRWFLARAMPVRDDTGQIVKWFGTCTDIDDQKRIEEALRQSQARVRALIDSNLIGIVSSEGEEEVLVEANEAFLQMSGYTQEDIDRRTLTRARISVPEDVQLFERALQELAARGQHTPFETELVCKDGSYLPILVGGVLFQDHPRQIAAFVLDNSARKELERRKDAFIGMASHELRNPLTALKLQTSLLHRQLARDGIPAAAALSSMEVQLNTVSRLVEELLDVSKIQAGNLEYLPETVDLDALLQEIADTMQQTHPSHRILVNGAVQASLIADRDRLGQVFTNLLSNAIKYSPDAKTVEMNLSASPETVTIRVRDHGLGIPQEQQEKIFERFYRASGPKQRVIPGLGMGLYIVAEIIKHHGGMITVESAVGKGSTFTVTLPLTRNG